MVSERGWHPAQCEVVFGPCLDQCCARENLGLAISTLFRSRTIRENDCRRMLNRSIAKISHIVKLVGKGPGSDSDLLVTQLPQRHCAVGKRVKLQNWVR
eukprot:2169283-Amphidinium_carterae.1